MPPRRAAAAAASRDRLSALPDDLLHRILRPLDARQAVRDLSLLSRRWRRVWASSPFVTVKDKGSAGSERFVNNLLLLRDPVDLQVLCLHSWQRGHFSFQRRWLCHALSRGLRVLELAIQGDYAVGVGGLPDRIFTCPTLEEISLSSRDTGIIAPKTAVYLPRVKKMRLENWWLIDPSLKLNSGCPSLEDLDLSRCWLDSFKISSETLKTLSITNCLYDEIHVSAPSTGSLKIEVCGSVYLSAMPSLVSAWVDCVGAAGLHLAPWAYDFIAVLCNARYLELYGFDILLLQDIVQKAATEGLSFSNLKSLHVGEILITDFYNALAFFLKRAPNLASLALDQWKNLYQRVLPKPLPRGTKPCGHGNLKLLPALPRSLETLWIRVSKGDDVEEFRKMRSVLKKTKPRETEVVWF